MNYYKVTVTETCSRNIIVKAENKNEAISVATNTECGGWQENQDYQESEPICKRVAFKNIRGRLVWERSIYGGKL